MRKMIAEIRYSLTSFYRNKGGMFWTFGFPIMLFVIIGFMYGQQGGPMTLYYLDNDHSQSSRAFLDALNRTGAVALTDGSGLDLSKMLKDGKIGAYMALPDGFQQGSATGVANVEVYYDKSQPASMALVSIIRQVADAFNIQISGATEKIAVNAQDVATGSMSTLEFMLPGILGMSIMSAAMNATVSINVKNRARGIFRKLATTPISRIEWNASKIVTQTIITLLSVALSVVFAGVIFGLRPNVDAMAVLLVVIGTVTFVGLGMIFAAFLKSEDTAASAASIVTFPLMFLSGSFFPVDSMPWFFKVVADVSPLTYLNNGLRDTMITANSGDAVTNLIIVGLIGAVFFIIGVAAMKWKED
jgi:ABC-2 type transport system permease protein